MKEQQNNTLLYIDNVGLVYTKDNELTKGNNHCIIYLPPHCSEQFIMRLHLLIKRPVGAKHRRVLVVVPQCDMHLDHKLHNGLQSVLCLLDCLSIETCYSTDINLLMAICVLY